jgi:steroid delta-isomerase-like uncharacterized protein
MTSPLAPEYQVVLLRHIKAETDHLMEETLATLTPNCIFEDHAFRRVWHGREGARDYYRMWWDAFGVAPHTTNRFFPAPDLVIVETRFKGRHVGEFLGRTATGRAIDVPMAIVVSFGGGLMSGERFYWDLQTLLDQIDDTFIARR